MPLISLNQGSVFSFTTKNGSTNQIIQIAGSEQIFPYAFYNTLDLAGSSITTTGVDSVFDANGPLFANALTYNSRVLRNLGSPLTHSIADLQIWSGSYSYDGGGAAADGGGLYEVVPVYAASHILIDLTSSISYQRSANGIPAGTILMFNLHNQNNSAHLRLTGSFFNNKTLLESTEDGATVTLIRSGRAPSNWYIQSIVGTWTIT